MDRYALTNQTKRYKEENELPVSQSSSKRSREEQYMREESNKKEKSITDAKTKKYTLTIPKTSKDRIKQPEAVKDGVLPALHFSMLIIGSSGSGKSVLAFNIIKKFYGPVFDMVILISPTGITDDIQAALGLPVSRVITDMRKAEQALQMIMDVQTEDIKKGGYEAAKNILVYFDDVVSNTQFMNSPVVIDAFIKNRHYKFSTILCSQYYKAITRRIRMQSACDIFFNCSETEMQTIADDFEPPGVSRNVFIERLQQILEEKYAFVTIMTHAPWSEKFRKGLTEPIDFHNSWEM